MLPLHDTAAARVKAGIALGWLGFVLLMVTIGVQEELSEGRPPVLWRPLVAEGTSLGVATLIAWLQWRRAAHLDHLLARPLRWFTATLAWALAHLRDLRRCRLRPAPRDLQPSPARSIGIRRGRRSWSTRA